MDTMKRYSQFLKELPSKTVVFAFGRFNPPTSGHELLVKAVKKLADQNKADHAIYATKSQDAKKNPLTVDKKVHYLKLMFPGTNFVAATPTERTFIEAAKALNKKYKNIIMVAGSDRIEAFEKYLNLYNGKEFHFDTVQVISAGDRDPDSDDASGMSASKMRAVASKGDYSQFKKGLPSAMRDIDGRRLMNDVRVGMGLETVKEQINLVKDDLREQYFRGEVFNIGDLVESAGVKYDIVKRGSNHLLLKDQSGKLVSKWIQDVQLCEDVSVGYAPEEITFGGYTTKNLHHSEDAAKAFQDTIERHGDQNPTAVLHALMATDTYMGLSDLHLNQGKAPTETEKDQWIQAHDHAKEHLDKLGEFLHHRDYWDNHMHEMEDMLSNYKEQGQGELQDSVQLEDKMIPEDLTTKTLKSQDKIKVARIIATMLGIENAESSANPEMLVNSALRKIRTKALNPEYLNTINKMLNLADEVGIKYDVSLKPSKLKESEEVVTKSKYNIAKGNLRYKDYIKLSKMNQGETHTKPGHALTAPHEDEQDRRMKIRYQTEAVDKNHPIVKEYEALKKNHDIKSLRALVGRQSRISDTSEYTSKDRAISTYLRNKHGHKKVADAFGLEEEIEDMVPEASEVCPNCEQTIDKCKCKSKDVVRDDSHQVGANNSKGFDAFFEDGTAVDMSAYDLHNDSEDEISDEDLDDMANEIQDMEHIIDAYDDEELAIVDDDTGEEVEDTEEEKFVNEGTLLEVLSRIERMKAKIRLKRTQALRTRKMKIALRVSSSSSKINKRSRRLAVKLIKNRLLRGRDPAKISVGEKERIERIIQKRKPIIGRLAMKLAPRVRSIEKARLQHKKFTGNTPAVGM